MEQLDTPLLRKSTGMLVLRLAVLTADALSLLCVLFIRFALPASSAQDGQASYWVGLLLVYVLFLILGLTLVLNVVYLVALAFMHGRYDKSFNRLSRALLFLLPAATAVVIAVK